jgi:3D-(3,5/4)-trihydroxycyclohexane-1,2-dione acylhydrolase (decyclizing)
VTTRRLTTAQALVAFLAAQRVARDGVEAPLFAGVLGIFGHGNVAGIGQALQEHGGLRYVLPRNEQAMVHTAAAFAKQRSRLQTFACTTSIGPGATNMVTGAAMATVNRLPVLLLPGDIFASRRVDPALQQLELPGRPEASVNDALAPVSRFFDRVNRPDQLAGSLLEAMRVLTDPAETGAVTVALPQDVQAEAHDFPEALFAPRAWRVRRPPPEADALARAAAAIRDARRPLIVAGGGVRYSEAWDALRALAEATGIPVAETQAGKGALPYDHPSALGAVGATGTRAANLIARDADLVLGVGTRFTDFTTASRTAFQAPGLRVIGLNVAPMDAFKLGALPLVADARAGLEALAGTLEGFRVDAEYAEHAARLNREWDEEVGRLYAGDGGPGLTQAEVIGVVNAAARPEDVVVCAAGSLPGDLHKLWRTRDPRGYHLEYGYSTMGYEVAGGLGVKLADPQREVFVMVGDGSWLMMSSEIATSIQEGVRLTVVLIDNGGFASIGGLSRSLGSDGFGTAYRARAAGGGLTGERLELDLAANARSLGAIGVRADSRQGLADALATARAADRTTVVVVDCDPARGVPAYEAWWDVAVAEVAAMPAVREARSAYEAARERQRPLLGGDDGG